jgi:hypothetical protein
MGNQRQVESIEAELRRTFEQIIPFNRVLGSGLSRSTSRRRD